MGDNELIKRIKSGDRESSDRLVARYYAAILRYCARQCPDLSLAEDLTQETFFRVFRDMARYEIRGSFKAYLYTIARRLCIDQARRPPCAALVEALSRADPELSRIDDRDQAERLLKKLSPEQREAVLLRFGEELSFREIAQITGVPARTAQSRVRLALAIMRKETP